MSFKAKFKVAGKEYNILNLSYDLAQETDATGRPSAVTRGGRIKLQVESTGETDLFEWMTNNFERKDGSITFLKRDTNSKLKELIFREAYMVKFEENFNHYGRTPFVQTFVLSAKSIEIGGGEFRNEWV